MTPLSSDNDDEEDLEEDMAIEANMDEVESAQLNSDPWGVVEDNEVSQVLVPELV